LTTTDGGIESTRSRSSAVPPADSEMQIDIGDLYKAVVRRRLLLAPALLLTFSLAGAYIFLTPARYAATMSLMVDIRERPPIGMDAQPVPQSPDTGLIESQMRLLTSNEVLRRLVKDEQLRSDPDFAPARPGIFARLKALVGIAPPKSEVTIEGIVENLGSAITAKRNEKSYVIDVEVKASSPEKAERLARGLVTAYHETQAQMGDEIADKEIDWLDKRIADFRIRLEQAEQRVQDYRKSKAFLVTDGHTAPETQLKDANSALVEARKKRAELQARYDQLQAAIRAGGSIENVNEAIRSPVIEKLRGDYATLSRDAAYAESTLGPRHPSYTIIKAQMASLRAQMKAEMQRISIAAANELKTARNTERNNEQLVADLEKSIRETGGRRLEWTELERQAAAVRERYEKALAARENVHREVVSSPNGVLINQPTAAKSKVSPKTLPALIIALAAGLNIWIAMALVLEFLERKRKAPDRTGDPSPQLSPAKPREDASDGAASDAAIAPIADSRWRASDGERPPVVVALPPMEAGGSDAARDRPLASRVKAAMEIPAAPYRRAVARLYDAIWIAPAAREAKVVALGASSVGAGVTSTALSLAFLACAQGDRVLLLDCDARRPYLASLRTKLPRAAKRFGNAGNLYTLHKDRLAGGEILIAERRWPQERDFKSCFDLVLLDCGVLLGGDLSLPPPDEIDALVMIEKSATRERNACLLFGEDSLTRRSSDQPDHLPSERRMRA
jgi:polysaccharide biosynthesis transport protein